MKNSKPRYINDASHARCSNHARCMGYQSCWGLFPCLNSSTRTAPTTKQATGTRPFSINCLPCWRKHLALSPSSMTELSKLIASDAKRRTDVLKLSFASGILELPRETLAPSRETRYELLLYNVKAYAIQWTSAIGEIKGEKSNAYTVCKMVPQCAELCTPRYIDALIKHEREDLRLTHKLVSMFLFLNLCVIVV